MQPWFSSFHEQNPLNQMKTAVSFQAAQVCATMGDQGIKTFGKPPATHDLVSLKDKYPNFEVGLKCILMVFPYLLLCSYINENALTSKKLMNVTNL